VVTYGPLHILIQPFKSIALICIALFLCQDVRHNGARNTHVLLVAQLTLRYHRSLSEPLERMPRSKARSRSGTARLPFSPASCEPPSLTDHVAQVNLVRRKSGGGAVYQDLGNSIFSFIGPKGSSSIEKNNTILLEVLVYPCSMLFPVCSLQSTCLS